MNELVWALIVIGFTAAGFFVGGMIYHHTFGRRLDGRDE